MDTAPEPVAAGTAKSTGDDTGCPEQGDSLTEKEAKVLASNFRRHRDALDSALGEADSLKFPVLQNVNAAQSVRRFLIQEEMVLVPAETIQVDEIHVLVRQADTVAERMQRIYFKSLGSILTLQEQLTAKVHEVNEDMAWKTLSSKALLTNSLRRAAARSFSYSYAGKLHWNPGIMMVQGEARYKVCMRVA